VSKKLGRALINRGTGRSGWRSKASSEISGSS